jgi:hypothetical protein
MFKGASKYKAAGSILANNNIATALANAHALTALLLYLQHICTHTRQ